MLPRRRRANLYICVLHGDKAGATRHRFAFAWWVTISSGVCWKCLLNSKKFSYFSEICTLLSFTYSYLCYTNIMSIFGQAEADRSWFTAIVGLWPFLLFFFKVPLWNSHIYNLLSIFISLDIPAINNSHPVTYLIQVFDVIFKLWHLPNFYNEAPLSCHLCLPQLSIVEWYFVTVWTTARRESTAITVPLTINQVLKLRQLLIYVQADLLWWQSDCKRLE
jgi:hypothetical protein